MKQITLLTLGLLLSCFSYAQKKPLDHSVYDDWQSVRQTKISDKGNYIIYFVAPQEGDHILYIHDLKHKTKTTIDRGYNYYITPNEKFLLSRIKPRFEQTKKHKRNKGKAQDAPIDTLVLASLPIQKIDTIGGVKSYKVSDKGNRFFAYQPADTVKTKSKGYFFKNPLVINEFGSQWCDTINYVDTYYFSKDGNRLVAVTNPNKKDTLQTEKQIVFYDLEQKEKKVISSGCFKYLAPRFSEDGNQLAFLAAQDTVLKTNNSYSLYYYRKGQEKSTKLIDTNYSQNLPDNWFFSDYSWVNFSHDGSKLFTSIAPLDLPSDTIKHKEETAQLDIWHYKDPQIQPEQLLNRRRALSQTYTTVIDLKNPHVLLPLSTQKYESVYRVNRGDADYAIIADYSKYELEKQWTGISKKDIYKIDYSTGNKKLLLEAFSGFISDSPLGKYILLYDLETWEWSTFDINQEKRINLTNALDVNFWDESHDNPGIFLPYGDAGWTENDDAVLLYDAYDIWQFDPKGEQKPICLTNHEGRNTHTSFRLVTLDSEKRFHKNNEQCLLTAFDKNTKDIAIATLNISKAGKPKYLNTKQGIQYDKILKAKEAEKYAYIKSNFQLCPDIYFTDNWKKSQQLSFINPQQKDYNWGSVELINWKAFDGQKVNGLLYKPEDFDENKKYPVMIYFYELHSDNLHKHHMPQPSWSTVNISFYCSRGYIVFVPDIHYTTGLPGESAYNCIVSGAQELTKNKWVDKDNMAIQGQSWGGYQVAYLITRTNMFKAAGSGAPVSNMTSAYGGIRWKTGTSRQRQYEQGQSRIGGTLWEKPELYIENSPIFKADKIETPLLIMHNDRDGAVPWYQGIELFMGMRRLQKPVWMLQYNNEEHNLVKRVNRKDLTIRLQQFFDYYLKGAPIPEWMEKGVPAVRKGKTWGTDLILK